METRTKHTYRLSLYDFIRDILVVCPQCQSCALVNTMGYTFFQREAVNIRVVCASCGFSKVLERRSTRSPKLIIGAPVDPFFHLPLWLQMEVGENLLWAYNRAHLDFLEQHVCAKLRERNGFLHPANAIGSRLPRWMTAARRRDEILKAIGQLRKK